MFDFLWQDDTIMDGIINICFGGETINWQYLGMCVLSFFIIFIYYFGLVSYFNPANYSDAVIFWNQLPFFLLWLSSAIFPMAGHLICVGFTAHFIAETIYFTLKGTDMYTIHHVYAAIYTLVGALMFNSTLTLFLYIPLINNIVFSAARLFKLEKNTRTLRQGYFVFARFLYPIIGSIIFINSCSLTGVHIFYIMFFSITISLLMMPPICTATGLDRNGKVIRYTKQYLTRFKSKPRTG